MNRQNLNSFADQEKISPKTLKRNFSDIIYRMGRQSYIDVDAYNVLLPKRGRKVGKQKMTPKQYRLRLDQAEIKRERLSHVVVIREKSVKVAKDDLSKKVAMVEYHEAKSKLAKQDSIIASLTAQYNELLDKQLEKFMVPELSTAGNSPKGK